MCNFCNIGEISVIFLRNSFYFSHAQSEPARLCVCECVGASIISLRANDVSKTMEPARDSLVFLSLQLGGSACARALPLPSIEGRHASSDVIALCQPVNLISRLKFKNENSHPREKTPFDFAGELQEEFILEAAREILAAFCAPRCSTALSR